MLTLPDYNDLPQSGHFSARPRPSVLLLEPDCTRLVQLSTGLRDAGFDVIATARIAEVERWPQGMLVVTDADYFTPWWTHVGASGAVVLARTREQGIEARRIGATAWILRNCSPGALVRVMHRIVGSVQS